MSANAADTEKVLKELQDDVLYTLVGQLKAGMSENMNYVEFLGKRPWREDNTLYSQPKHKVVDTAVEMLGLTGANPALAPTTLELVHREGGE